MTIFRAAFTLLLTVLLLGTSALAQQPPNDGFVPLDQLPAREQLPAAPLVMTAYAVAWAAVFVYLWTVWRRLGRVEQEMREISRRVEAGRRT